MIFDGVKIKEAKESRHMLTDKLWDTYFFIEVSLNFFEPAKEWAYLNKSAF